MKEFKGKALVITGGGSGIGEAIAKEGALRGMKVVINDIDEPAVDRVVGELRAMGAEAVGQKADISLLENVQALLKLTMDTYGQVDMLVNNAGVSVSGPIWEIPTQDVKWITEVNMMSHLYGMQVFLPQMISQGTEGVVINTESTAGLMTSGNAVMYHATKFAGVAASEGTYLALKNRGLGRIQVHCLMPAFVKTGIHLSDAHRPGRYAINDDPYYESQEFKAGYIRSERQVVGGMPIDYVGTCVFTAVEDEKFYIFTHPESQMVAGMRIQNLVNGKNPQ
ncbi:1-deoxy-11-beta-hydroxypentalenate dehydrogenase [bioreactor metagenome]|uniref:1-deoxy-11-beta-hydroxypentalenate dehydrogenase n=1 Tax=bioreactor metagenome TaxID=1076179 RepID=A0A645A8N0_9ZZZZ